MLEVVTWLHSQSFLSLLEISGCDFCHVDRKGEKGGGVAIMIMIIKCLIFFRLQLQTIQNF